MICETLLDTIGNTPLIKLQKTSKYFSSNNCSVYIKWEAANPGGSHKTRIAYAMIKAAENEGTLKPFSGQTILEPSGGNTGIGIAIVANIRGYKVCLVIPDNYSPEKQKILKSYGAEIILSDSSKGNNSHGELATNIFLHDPDKYIMLNQSANPANPEIHRKTTAPEIIRVLNTIGAIPDIFVGGVGTGGSISGVGEILKKRYLSMKVFCVQPYGCDILNNVFIKHKIQGLAVGIIPKNLNINIIDKVVSVKEEEALELLKIILKYEGLHVGVSTAANLAAIKKISEQSDRLTFVTIAYDTGYQYLDHFL